MQHETFSGPLRRAMTTNRTSYRSLVPTKTRPSGDGIIDLGDQSVASNGLLVMPFGVGANDQVPTLRLNGWRRLPGNGTTTVDIYVAFVIFDISFILSSTLLGLAGTELATTDYQADTITLVTGNDDVDISITSPTGNVPAHLIVDLKGCTLYQFDGAAGTGTSANALIANI